MIEIREDGTTVEKVVIMGEKRGIETRVADLEETVSNHSFFFGLLTVLFIGAAFIVIAVSLQDAYIASANTACTLAHGDHWIYSDADNAPFVKGYVSCLNLETGQFTLAKQ